FADNRDKVKFLKILSATKDLYGVEVHAYVLMDNHFHLVAMTPEANLSAFMQRFNTAYTVYYNFRHQRSGHLYQGRYKAILVEADNHLLELSRYLHLNPVRVRQVANLAVKKKRDILRRYRWSSYRGYVHPTARDPLVTYTRILAMIGETDDRESRQRYDKFVMSGISKEVALSFWKGVKGQSVLGSESFVDWVYDSFLSSETKDDRELPAMKDLKGGPTSVDEIAERVSSEFTVEPEDLYRPWASCRDARSVFMELCRLHLSRKMSLAEIGRRLGDVSSAAFSRNKLRLQGKISGNPLLRKRFERLMRILGGQGRVNS
ncbi:MAG: transposase, partial [Desulfobacteraceae bacterium]